MRAGLIVVLQKVKEAATAASENIKTHEGEDAEGCLEIEYTRVINADKFVSKLEELIQEEKQES